MWASNRVGRGCQSHRILRAQALLNCHNRALKLSPLLVIIHFAGLLLFPVRNFFFLFFFFYSYFRANFFASPVMRLFPSAAIYGLRAPPPRPDLLLHSVLVILSQAWLKLSARSALHSNHCHW